jgi:hypothetical protein
MVSDELEECLGRRLLPRAGIKLVVRVFVPVFPVERLGGIAACERRAERRHIGIRAQIAHVAGPFLARDGAAPDQLTR